MTNGESIDEQSLRLLRAFVNIDDADAREVIITIAKFAESRARNNRVKAADGHARM